MARSWERQVRKNSAQLNKQRKKEGKPSIYSTGGPSADIYKGRNYVLPITMVALAAVYFLLGMLGQEGTAGNSGMTWIIMAMYVFLGLMIFCADLSCAWRKTPYRRSSSTGIGD